MADLNWSGRTNFFVTYDPQFDFRAFILSNIFKEYPKIAMKFDMDIMRDVGPQTKVEAPRIQFFRKFLKLI